MVEAAGERSRVVSLIASPNPSKRRQLSPELSAVTKEELSPATEERPTTAHGNAERSRSSHDSTGSLATGLEVSPDSICSVCLNLGNEVWDSGYRKRHSLGEYEEHYMPAGEAAIAAKKGCPGCEIIAWALEPYMERVQDGELHIHVHFDNAALLVSGYLHYYSCVPSKKKYNMLIDLKSAPFEGIESAPHQSNNIPCPWRFIEPISIVTGHTGSSAALRKVQKWYLKCLLNHKRCNLNSRSRLPTRLIQIQGPTKVRLYTGGFADAEYACLSHCWGRQPLIQTTTATLKQYTNDIPWGELPKTFQDAIQFAHGIGFRYLWIDSLCIIQDSIDDWRHEGSRMSRIFANASLTLAATWSANPRQGCFATLDERYTSRTKTFKNGDRNTYQLYCRNVLPEGEAPLLDRGWVFQERILSRRIVHFMAAELWWECRECFDCECGSLQHSNSHMNQKCAFDIQMFSLPKSIECSYCDDEERRASHDSYDTTSLSHAIRCSSNKARRKLQIQAIEQRWEELVTTYSSKSLTYQDDIFPAIQALAKLVPPEMGRYLAGHWESFMISSLGWLARAPAQNRTMKWRAPSWSWAATHGEVYWPIKIDFPLEASATLLSALTVPIGDDPMGQISHGFIVLRGKLVAGEIQSPSRASDYGLMLEGKPFDKIDHYTVYWDRICRREVGKGVFALRLFEFRNSSHVYQFWLILEAVESSERQYERIGLLITDSSFSGRYSSVEIEMQVKII